MTLPNVLYVTKDDVKSYGLDQTDELQDGVLVGVYQLVKIQKVKEIHRVDLEDCEEEA